MPYPRAHLIAPGQPGWHHLIGRCVRRAWLCGFDETTGIDYEHRRELIFNRLRLLVEVFAIEVWTYAILSNHYHLVIHVDPPRTAQWSDLEVAERWLRLTLSDDCERKHQAVALSQNTDRIAQLRDRLGSVSWFMRYLNEYIARIANAEDQCKGRFWESRFKSYKLLDEPAELGSMVYGDLNPVRAGMVDVPEEARFVSFTQRVKEAEDEESAEKPLRPVLGGPVPPVPRLNITAREYVALVRFTATKRRNQRLDRLFSGLFAGESDWKHHYDEQHQRNRRAYGSLASLTSLAERLGQKWLHGMGSARKAAAAST